MSRVQINKRLLYGLAFLFVAVPVVVGVLVWHFTDTASSRCEDEDARSASAQDARASTGGQGTTEAQPSPSSTPRAPTAEEIAAQPWLSLRLPDYQVPLHYDITLYPDFYGEHGTFEGNETVDIAINRTTKFLLIHVLDLDIHHVGVSHSETGEVVEVAQTFEEPGNQFLVVETREEMAAGSTVQLSLRFTGSLTKSIVGFYKSRYVNSQTGETRWVFTR